MTVAKRPRVLHPVSAPARARLDALRAAGISQTVIADTLGVSGSVVSAVLHGRARNRRVAVYIASLIGRPAEELWPEIRPRVVGGYGPE